MAFDGVTVAAIVKECDTLLTGSRIHKIAQPEPDELLLTLKSPSGSYRLLLSAGASLPLIYITSENKKSPMTAPNFCMLLRKHIQNGRIISITQPGLERIMRIEIEHLNELGDLCKKTLIVEVMGKHSNIIFCDETNTIIDSIKHISGFVSSIRQVLPGKEYFIPQTTEKLDPIAFSLHPDFDQFFLSVFGKAIPLSKAIYSTFTGFSPLLAQELCFRSRLDSDRPASSHTSDEARSLFFVFLSFMEQITRGNFQPVIVYENGIPGNFATVDLTMYSPDCKESYLSTSQLLEAYYSQKNAYTRIRQKSADLRRIVQTALERTVKKYDLQCQQIKDTQKRETYKLYGELLHTYGYQAPAGAKSIEVENYYTGKPITIPLDETKSAAENAKRYFDKYGKMKRTYETLSTLITEVKSEIDHLDSVMNALDIAEVESDLTEIKEELIHSGYIKKRGTGKREKTKSKPFHFISRDGFDIFVGKNNYQNDTLTFKFATGNDWWFHAKGIPGSHVIVRTKGEELPDSTFEDAARLAAFYSKGRSQEKVEIDYIQKKHVKKPSGAKPGFVVYYTNYSMMIDSNISSIQQVNES